MAKQKKKVTPGASKQINAGTMADPPWPGVPLSAKELFQIFASAADYNRFRISASPAQRLDLVEALYAGRVERPNDVLRVRALAELNFDAGRYVEAFHWGKSWATALSNYRAHRILALSAAHLLDLPAMGDAYNKLVELGAPDDTILSIAILNRHILGRHDEAQQLAHDSFVPLTRTRIREEPAIRDVLCDVAIVTQDATLASAVLATAEMDLLPRSVLRELERLVRRAFLSCLRRRNV